MLSLIMMTLSLTLKLAVIAVKLIHQLRLWPAVLYAIFLATVLSDWSGTHEQASMISIGVVACLCLLTWFLPPLKSRAKIK